MVTLCPLANTVAVVKVTVTAFPVNVGILSAVAIVLDTEDTDPPNASGATIVVLLRSFVVDTHTPLHPARTGPPMVAPVRVSVMAPAATSAVVATMYAGAVPEVVVAKLVPVAPMVPLM